MSIEDRDYYREHWRKQRAEEQMQVASSKPNPVPLELKPSKPPQLWGSDWHWSLKLLVWLAILVLLLAARRLLT